MKTSYFLLLLLTLPVSFANSVEVVDDEAVAKQLHDLSLKVFNDENKGKERAVVEAWLDSLGAGREHAAVLGTFMFMVQVENWKRRWDEDTRELTDELKKTQEQLVEQSIQRTKAENALKAKDAEIADLKAQLAKAAGTKPEQGK